MPTESCGLVGLVADLCIYIYVPFRELTYPTKREKENHRLKSAWHKGNMLVPWYIMYIFQELRFFPPFMCEDNQMAEKSLSFTGIPLLIVQKSCRNPANQSISRNPFRKRRREGRSCFNRLVRRISLHEQ